MIISIGTDIIEVARIRQTIERTPKFTDRVFTAGERDYCSTRGVVSAQHYAARFAAKEATLKALGTGWGGGVAWHDVEVCSMDSGAPYIKLTGVALQLFRKAGGTAVHLSISHTSDFAIAYVIVES